jgi:allantoate deiminase/N-carbamoyl-L-amino-acid hydrolase
VIALEQLNHLPPDEFVARLAAIFEHSPWVPQRAQLRRPFESRLSLLDVMRSVVQEASGEEQLALINAHPKLGARGRTRAQLTAASSIEQRRAGLDACSDEQYAQLQRINAIYYDKFSFPFILAVRGHDPASIIAQLQDRCGHDRAVELRAALKEIGLIASYRLAESVSSMPAAEIRAMLARLQDGHQGSLITEWMRAANLAVASAGEQRLIGIAHSSTPDASTLLTGLHYDRVTASLMYDGWLGCTTGIALAARLRELGMQLPFDLAVFADTHAEAAADLASTGAGLVPRERVTLESIDATQPHNRATLAALREAGFKERDCVMEGDLLFTDVERLANALQEFLWEIPR